MCHTWKNVSQLEKCCTFGKMCTLGKLCHNWKNVSQLGKWLTIGKMCQVKVGKVCIRAKWPIRPELIPVSVAWSDWEYSYSPLDGMLVHRRVTPSIKFAGTRLYTWVERGTVRVKCLAQEHNTMPKNTTQCPQPGLEPGPLAPESSALTMRPPRHTCVTLGKMRHTWKHRSQLKPMSQLEKCVTIKKMCQNWKMGHTWKMAHNWKNMSQYEKWLTLRKMAHTWKSVSQLEKWLTLGKMCHNYKNESHLEN